MANCHEQFRPVGGIVFCWDLHSGVLRDFVQVGGGLIVVATGWTLLRQKDDEKHDVHRTVEPQDTFRHAFYPLTMPLTVGPGSISVAVTLGANAAHSHALHPLTIVAARVGCVLIALCIFCATDLLTGWGDSCLSNGNDGNRTTVVISPGLYRSADYVERDEGVSGIPDASHWLSEEILHGFVYSGAGGFEESAGAFARAAVLKDCAARHKDLGASAHDVCDCVVMDAAVYFNAKIEPARLADFGEERNLF
jgi:hypothetical protein